LNVEKRHVISYQEIMLYKSQNDILNNSK